MKTKLKLFFENEINEKEKDLIYKNKINRNNPYWTVITENETLTTLIKAKNNIDYYLYLDDFITNTLFLSVISSGNKKFILPEFFSIDRVIKQFKHNNLDLTAEKLSQEGVGNYFECKF